MVQSEGPDCGRKEVLVLIDLMVLMVLKVLVLVMVLVFSLHSSSSRTFRPGFLSVGLKLLILVVPPNLHRLSTPLETLFSFPARSSALFPCFLGAAAASALRQDGTFYILSFWQQISPMFSASYGGRGLHFAYASIWRRCLATASTSWNNKKNRDSENRWKKGGAS